MTLNLRLMDKLEITAYGISVRDGLKCCVQSQRTYLAVDENNKPLWIYGIEPAKTDLGYAIWFLATGRMQEHKIAFIRESKQVIKRWLKQYGTLYNYVYKDNVESIKWLAWLGATFSTRINTPKGLEFVLFQIRGDKDV